MTTYLWLSLVVLLPVLAISAAAIVVGAGRGSRRRTLLACAVTLVGLTLLTVVFDSVIVGTGIVGYDASRILGVRIGIAPVEDFAYPVAAAFALPALWCVLPHRRARGRRP